MACTLAVLEPDSNWRSMLVEVHSAPAFDDDILLVDFMQRLRERGIYLGVLVTRVRTYVVQWRLEAGNYVQSPAISTTALLVHAGFGPPLDGPAQFEHQVRQWLEAIGFSWYTYLLPAAAPFMVPDVVGHLVGAYLEPWPGLLGPYDAV